MRHFPFLQPWALPTHSNDSFCSLFADFYEASPLGPANHLLPRQQLRVHCLYRFLVGQELARISSWVTFEMELCLYVRWNHGFTIAAQSDTHEWGGHTLRVPLDMGLHPQKWGGLHPAVVSGRCKSHGRFSLPRDQTRKII